MRGRGGRGVKTCHVSPGGKWEGGREAMASLLTGTGHRNRNFSHNATSLGLMLLSCDVCHQGGHRWYPLTLSHHHTVTVSSRVVQERCFRLSNISLPADVTIVESFMMSTMRTAHGHNG